MSTYKIRISIQEIVEDFYNLGNIEGYLDGLMKGFNLTDDDKLQYHEKMKSMIIKYIPNYKEHVDEKYFLDSTGDDEKGLILSMMLYENFKEIFCKLI